MQHSAQAATTAKGVALTWARQVIDLTLQASSAFIGLLPAVLAMLKGVDPQTAAVATKFVVSCIFHAGAVVIAALVISGIHTELSAAQDRKLSLSELTFRHDACLQLLGQYPPAPASLIAKFCNNEADAQEQLPPEPTTTSTSTSDQPTEPEEARCCVPSAATYTDLGLLNARNCIVQHYKNHGVVLTQTATAAQLRACTDEDASGDVTLVEIVRLVTHCGMFPDSTPASTVTEESRRDMLRC